MLEEALRTSFNPRLRTGGDRILLGICLWSDLVSIHASAREATEKLM